MQLNQAFVQLPYRFDATRLRAEVDALSEELWLPHPSGLAGNSALPLVSHDGGANNDFVGCMQPTPALEQCEYLHQVLASFGEVIGRSRLMKLDAGAEVTRHVDFNYHWYTRVRIHVPIITEPEVTFYCDGNALHMPPGDCWIFDSWRYHNVVNRGRNDRIHLVVDTAGSSRFWNTVRAMEGTAPSMAIKQIDYQPGQKPELKTERFNSAPVMAPGEMDALCNSLIADFTGNSANDAATVKKYCRLLDDLCKDWRELWHLHGMAPTGWPAYRKLLDRTAQQLTPGPRALVTHSNDVGVNPIIMQRILRAALNPEEHARFTQA